MYSKQTKPVSEANPNDREITSDVSGLFLFGKVIDRSRRFVPRDNPTTEIVTYTVEDDSGRKYYVDDYAPQGIYYEVNKTYKWPVYVKPYVRKNKEVSYTLGLQKKVQMQSRGERF